MKVSFERIRIRRFYGKLGSGEGLGQGLGQGLGLALRTLFTDCIVVTVAVGAATMAGVVVVIMAPPGPNVVCVI